MKLVHQQSGDPSSRRRERVLKTVAVLPSLATLGNLVCGLGAIYFGMLSVHAAGAGDANPAVHGTRLAEYFPSYLAIAAYLVFAAMLFDGLDGRLARLTRKTSEFGGQLDSLADVISFGAAPALLVLCATHPGSVADLDRWDRVYWRLEWVMAATFACCAALRLARFNVENVEDESAHLGFRGLPTPGAAAALIGMVILHEDLLKDLLRDLVPGWTLKLVASILPPFAVALGLLMVSRFRYAHLINVVLRGRRPFRQVVAIVILTLVGLVVQFQFTIAVVGAAYALSGPVLSAVRALRGGAKPDDRLEPLAEWEDDSDTFADLDEDASDDAADDRRGGRNARTVG